MISLAASHEINDSFFLLFLPTTAWIRDGISTENPLLSCSFTET